MKKVAIAIAITVLAFSACKPKKKADDADKGGMTPAAMEEMEAMEPADDAMRPAPVADDAMRPAPPADDAMRPAPAGDDATAEFEQILAKQKELAKIMEGTKTLDDIKKNMPEYVKIQTETLKLTVASLKKAVKLDAEQLKAYVAKYTAMNKANAEFGKQMIATQKRLMKIKGAKKLNRKMQKEVGEKLKPLLKELGALTKEFMKKTAALKKAEKKAAKKGGMDAKKKSK